MTNLTPTQATDLIFIQSLIGCNEAQVKANLEHFHGDNWTSEITPMKEHLMEQV